MASAAQCRISFSEVSSVTRPSATSTSHFRISETMAWPALGSHRSPGPTDRRWEQPLTSSFTLPLPRRAQPPAPDTSPSGPACSAQQTPVGPRGLLTAGGNGKPWPPSAAVDAKGAPAHHTSSGGASAVTVRPIAVRAAAGMRASSLAHSSPLPPFGTAAGGAPALSKAGPLTGGSVRWSAHPSAAEAPPFSSPTTRHAASGLLGLGVSDATAGPPPREAAKGAASKQAGGVVPDPAKRATAHGALALLSLAAEEARAPMGAPAPPPPRARPHAVANRPPARPVPHPPAPDEPAVSPPVGRGASAVRWRKMSVAAGSPPEGAPTLPPRAESGLVGHSSLLFVRLHPPRVPTTFQRVSVAFDDFAPIHHARRANLPMANAARLGAYRVCAGGASAALRDVDQHTRPEEANGRLSRAPSASHLSSSSLPPTKGSASTAALAGAVAAVGAPIAPHHAGLGMLQRVNSMSSSSRESLSSRLGSPSDGGYSEHAVSEAAVSSSADANSLPTSPVDFDEASGASADAPADAPAAHKADEAPVSAGTGGAGTWIDGQRLVVWEDGAKDDDPAAADAVADGAAGAASSMLREVASINHPPPSRVAAPPAKRQRPNDGNTLEAPAARPAGTSTRAGKAAAGGAWMREC